MAWQPKKQWRKARYVISTCYRLARRWSGPYAIGIYLEDDNDFRDIEAAAGLEKLSLDADDNDFRDIEAAAGLEKLSLDADDNDFRDLVKEKRVDCFRRLGGSAGLAKALASGLATGICGEDEDVQRRREAFGANTFRKPRTKGFLGHMRITLSNVILLAHLFCAAVSLGFGIKEHGLKEGWYDGVSILLNVFLTAVVSAVSNHFQERQFNRLAHQSDDFAIAVVRGARRRDVSIFDLVVGDVVVLRIGDIVPADGVVLEGHALQVDESSITGEPHPVDIDAEKNPFLASRVKVIDGYGAMLVTAVGARTTWGEMMGTIAHENTVLTPLQERLEWLTSSTGKLGVTVAGLVLAALTAWYFTGGTRDKQGQSLFDRSHRVTFHSVFSALVEIFLQAFTIVVVAIAEGQSIAVRLTLAFSMKKMVRENALVRRLSACETMGSVTAICTDKTGTLTLNQMRVTEFWVGTDRPAATNDVDGRVLSLLRQGAGLNTTGSVYRPDNVSPPEISGSPTEKALLSWAVEELAMDADALKRSCKVLRVEAFNSNKKRSGVLVRDGATGAVTAHWKGAAEMVLASCSTYVGSDGAARELGAEQRRSLEKVISDMAAGSLRCIAFAYRQIQVDEDAQSNKIEDEGLTLLGFVGLKDPCRPEVKDSIEACTRAGVAVKMVTGGNVLTARAIAMECGIISSSGNDDPDSIVVEGHEFRTMSPEQQLDIVDHIRVMARSLPMDKLTLVQRLKQKGHVVAVTGEDINDALVLKEADVGLCMGIQGTEVAKESSDIVILNDSFDTVVTATRWGRCIFNNIQKFIQFQLTVNVAALLVNFVSAVTTGKMLLTTVQLLWVNLITDTMGALALPMDTPTDVLMRRPPIDRAAPLISNAMWRNLLAQASFQVAVLLALQFRGRDIFGIGEKANGTIIFNAFVLCQMFNEFNAREIGRRNVFGGVLRNRMFLGIIVVTIAMQVVMVELLTRFAGTQRLTLVQWGVCVAIAIVSWSIGWAVKFIPVPERPCHEMLLCLRKIAIA